MPTEILAYQVLKRLALILAGMLLADLLLVDGNPLEDLGAVTDQDNIKIIMKDGKIYKNTL